MLTLTREDLCTLESIAREHSLSGEEEHTLQVLVDGFSLYGSEDLVNQCATRDEFFRSRQGRLLENVSFAGKTYEDVFGSREGRDYLCRLVGSLGVTIADVEDVTQEICRKLWKSQWVERYNPLISSWRHFLQDPVQNSINTYYRRNSTKVLSVAARLDRRGPGQGSPFSESLYEMDIVDTPENLLSIHELLADWEDFLGVQPPLRDVLDRGFKRLCTLIPPGIPEIPTEEEISLFFVSGGVYNCRVTTQELHDLGISHMVPNDLLVDYIAEDPETHEYLYVECTGEYLTQKYYPNPNYDPRKQPVRIKRHWLTLYHCLRDGMQIEEIAQFFKVAPPSIPSWVQKLEQLFRDFWLISGKIPCSLKKLAVKTYRCPECYRLSLKSSGSCSRCGESMVNERAEFRLDAYPWPRAYARRDTFERLGNRRVALTVKRCSVS